MEIGIQIYLVLLLFFQCVFVVSFSRFYRFSVVKTFENNNNCFSELK